MNLVYLRGLPMTLKDSVLRASFVVMLTEILKEVQLPPKLFRGVEKLRNLLRDEEV